MLCISRKIGQSFEIRNPDGTTTVVVLYKREGGKIRVGIDAPSDYTVVRSEVPPKQAG